MIKHPKRFAKHARRFLAGPRLGHREIEDALRQLGVRAGGILLVHSSLSALGYVVGGADAVIAALRNVVGKAGTLVLPTHTWQWMDSGARTFDVSQTRVCVGTIPEGFRSLPGVVRSIHPTHSVAALGPQAECLVEGHSHAATPCGQGTPYAKILERDGQILLLGTGLESNTAFHTIESIVNAPYLMRHEPELFNIIDAHGQSWTAPFHRHLPGVRRRFRSIERMLLDRGIARKDQVGSAPTLLISALAFRDVMTQAFFDDSTVFLEDSPVPG